MNVSNFRAVISVQLKESVLDPQGQAVLHALHNMNFAEVQDVRIGKMILLRLTASDRAQAESQVKKYCDELLSNPVIETYSFQLENSQ